MDTPEGDLPEIRQVGLVFDRHEDHFDAFKQLQIEILLKKSELNYVWRNSYLLPEPCDEGDYQELRQNKSELVFCITS